jgi:hypothetical protein
MGLTQPSTLSTQNHSAKTGHMTFELSGVISRPMDVTDPEAT